MIAPMTDPRILARKIPSPGPRCGVAPPSITTMDIYRGIIPFVLIQVLCLVLLAIFPGLATWLPSVLFGS